MIEEAKKWAAERERIFNVEAETGILDHDAIQGSDDDAVDFALWVAAGCPDHVPTPPVEDTTGWPQFKLRGEYETFTITKVVSARNEDHAYEMTGIAMDLEAIGWKVSEIDGESWEITEVTS
jgi:hypothetical protein